MSSRAEYGAPETSGCALPRTLHRSLGGEPPPDYGYFHGPIPNPNPTWRPHPDPRTPVTTADNENAPTPGSRLSGINSMVCDIAVNGNQIFAATSGTPIPVPAKRIAGENDGSLADVENCPLREGAWGPMYGIIQDYCNFLEQLAQEDNNFAQQFGTEFHRPVYDPGIYSTIPCRKSPHYPLSHLPHRLPQAQACSTEEGSQGRKQPARAKKDAAESVPETA
ncbi:uncharacterized protein ATNIH1004_009466 [Aspergillus tanneri]|uniref:Uncharacterized protein n=1 Tax=Aspergillus tanneri TaxID=1220188 RepID=A0A5M9MBR3_9EURO|nr:uncharacterized protein ATNIH1004_009466 [Aspergillus tanneri]KAA8642714.1 hypothetical protein ATNIH1004_009466 [Aspergillus tanneri]